MPKKGDDFNAAIAAATIDHLSNTTGTYTPKPLVHPGVNSSKVPGIQTKIKSEVNGYLTFLPAFAFVTGAMRDPITLAPVTPSKGGQISFDGQDYTVQEAEVESSGMTRLILETTPT